MIVHVMGLPGAGKSTLTTGLAEALRWPVLSIGACRRNRPPDPLGEHEAWRAFYQALDEHGWSGVIVETSGLNGRLARLNEEAPAGGLLRVKLSCEHQPLHDRVHERDRDREPQPWAYSASIPDRHAFIDRFYDAFAKVPADIEIDTGRYGPDEVLKRVRQRIAGWTGEL